MKRPGMTSLLLLGAYNKASTPEVTVGDSPADGCYGSADADAVDEYDPQCEGEGFPPREPEVHRKTQRRCAQAHCKGQAGRVYVVCAGSYLDGQAAPRQK